AASRLRVDQDKSQKGSLSAEFDVPGTYLFVCKVHPYMTGVVLVEDRNGNVPDITSAELPFIGHLGLASMPPAQVAAVTTTIAPDDATKRAKWDLRTVADEHRPSIPGIGEIWIATQFERVPGQTD